MTTGPYTDDPRLRIYDLGASVVLGLEPRPDGFRLRVDFVLTPEHPLWRSPRRGERVPRQGGELRFAGADRIEFSPPATARPAATTVAPSTIDVAELHDDGWFLAGGWGELRVTGGELGVALFPDAVTPPRPRT